jgi:DNA-binding NtrC family response regulator
MPPETQAKVLRVLQERSFERVGGAKPIQVDVRVVAATHRNLEEEVRQGRFREDLYYRLRVVEIELPPLRERIGDVPSLALRFLEQVNERLGREKQRFSEAALAQLARQRWPGNVRELRNAIEQASVLASGAVIDVADLRLGNPIGAAPASTPAGVESPTSDGVVPDGAEGAVPFSEAKRRAVEGFERDFLLRALRAHGGNISRAAESIGMVRQSLQQKIRELGLRSEDWSEDE